MEEKKKSTDRFTYSDDLGIEVDVKKEDKSSKKEQDKDLGLEINNKKEGTK